MSKKPIGLFLVICIVAGFSGYSLADRRWEKCPLVGNCPCPDGGCWAHFNSQGQIDWYMGFTGNSEYLARVCETSTTSADCNSYYGGMQCNYFRYTNSGCTVPMDNPQEYWTYMQYGCGGPS